ncbi:MAG: chemotaxis protein CheW [Methylacidiphilales bacterium]|nr:chemotaxis protein CheW [Candidatus Methylacidiphilales bacterium]
MLPSNQKIKSGLLSTIGDSQVIISLEYFYELSQIASPIALCNTVPWFLGVQSVRGRIVPITHLYSYLTRKVSSQENHKSSFDNAKVLIIDFESELFGFAIDGVLTNIFYKNSEITELLISLPNFLKPYVKNMIRTSSERPLAAEQTEVAIENCPLLDMSLVIRDPDFINIQAKTFIGA